MNFAPVMGLSHFFLKETVALAFESLRLVITNLAQACLPVNWPPRALYLANLNS